MDGKAQRNANKGADGREAANLTTVWVTDEDGHMEGWALTDNERKRVKARAKRNPEDMPKKGISGLLHHINRELGKLLGKK